MHLTRLRTVVRERLMGTHGVVVGEVGTQDPAQMGLIENEKWSRHSRRMEPITRSAKGFCQGALGAVITCRIPMVLRHRVKAAP